MLPKVANHLILHTSRVVALAQGQSGALRNALQSGPAGAGSSWGSAGTGAGPGGAKFHAGGKFYKGYTVRVIVSDVDTAHLTTGRRSCYHPG